MSISALEIVTPAAGYPIEVEDAKRQLRVTRNHENDHIQSLIAAATSWAQNEMRRIIMNTEVRINIDRFPRRDESVWWVEDFRNIQPHFKHERSFEHNARDRAIFLPGGRVTAVDLISYRDEADAAQTLTGPTSVPAGTGYQEDLTDEDEAFVFPAIESDWPSVRDGRVNSVSVQYQVGYGEDSDDVPDDIKQAIRFRVADLFNIRDSADAGNRSDWFVAAENLLAPHRILVF